MNLFLNYDSILVNTSGMVKRPLIGRTVTTIKGKGLISGDKEVLYCVLTRIEIYLVHGI